jgi:hypothetical protein
MENKFSSQSSCRDFKDEVAKELVGFPEGCNKKFNLPINTEVICGFQFLGLMPEFEAPFFIA